MSSRAVSTHIQPQTQNRKFLLNGYYVERNFMNFLLEKQKQTLNQIIAICNDQLRIIDNCTNQDAEIKELSKEDIKSLLFNSGLYSLDELETVDNKGLITFINDTVSKYLDMFEIGRIIERVKAVNDAGTVKSKTPYLKSCFNKAIDAARGTDNTNKEH